MKNQIKHYELTDETKDFNGVALFRIKCTKKIKWANVGDFGGWMSKNATLMDNAWVSGNAQISGNARISGNAWVYGDARVYGDAWVYGNAQVYGDARVYGDAMVSGNARVYGDAEVYGDAQISGNAWVYGNAQISGDAWVCGDAEISGNAWVSGNSDYCLFTNFSSENRTTTFFKCKDNLVKLNYGCFFGTIKEFTESVIKTHGDNVHAKTYLAIIEVVKIKFNI